MADNTSLLTNILQSDTNISFKSKLSLVLKLSIPGIIAQISSILMQYIDAAMVGSLGSLCSASIGVVASSTWLIGGVCNSFVMGYTVQFAQYTGASKRKEACSVLCQAFINCILFSLLMMIPSYLISYKLPYLLKADSSICLMASDYFRVFSLSIPFFILVFLMTGLLQCSGNMKIPSIMNSLLCFLDVVFNCLFIFPSRHICISGFNFIIPGFNLGVKGAAVGTLMSQLVIAFVLTVYVFKYFNILSCKNPFNSKIILSTFTKGLKISLPMAVEQIAICGAMIAGTRIVAPLGPVSIAANSFAVTAESLCYMPGYGIQEAATALVGQSLGAKKSNYARHFAFLSVALGMIIMALMGFFMFFACPFIFDFLTPDNSVRELGIKVLRIELFAEPLFAASIVSSGALRGAGDTLIPSIMNFISIWGVRLGLSVALVGKYGLTGVWIAMLVELCFRGIILLWRLIFGNWSKKELI